MLQRKSDKRKAPKKIKFGPAELAIRGLLRSCRIDAGFIGPRPAGWHSTAEQELTKKFLPMLYRMAIHAARTDNDIEDFVQLAYLFFRDCIRTFDFRRGTKFITHCYARIPLQLLRPRADYAELIHIPSSAYNDGARSPLIASLDIHYETDHGEPHSSEWLAFFESDFGEEFDRRALIARMQDLIAKLPAQEQAVIRMRMNSDTLKNIGELLGISKERVRQIERHAQEMLRCWLTGAKLSNFLQARIARQASKLQISATGQ